VKRSKFEVAGEKRAKTRMMDSSVLASVRVWYGVGARSICQADPLAGYKAVVPRRFSINSLHPFLLPLHFSDVSYLRPLASSTFSPILPCGPAAPQKDTTKPVRRMPPPRDCWLLFARGLGSTLSSTAWLWVSPSVMTKDDADDVT
jgi:hypothetical protein